MRRWKYAEEKPNKIVNFFAEKGFYIILILCIAAIGISGYVLFFSDNSDDNDMLYVNDPDLSNILSEGEDPAPTPYETEMYVEIPDYANRESEIVMEDDFDDLSISDNTDSDDDSHDDTLTDPQECNGRGRKF